MVVVANRAFGGHVLTDQAPAHGWDGLAPVHGQTRWRDRQGRIPPMVQQVAQRGDRWNGQGEVFKDAGWRSARLVALWGLARQKPLVLVSSLPLSRDLIAIYRQRAAVEALFRDGKSSGRRRESSRVRDLTHQEHLVAGLGLATLITLVLGVQAAEAERSRPARRHRRQSWRSRQSWFLLGREAFWHRLWRRDRTPIRWDLTDLDGRNWSAEQRARHALAGADLGRRAAWWRAHWNARNRQKAHMFCPPLNPHRKKEESGVLMPETGDGTQGLHKKPAPVSKIGCPVLKGEDRCRFGLMLLGVDVEMRVITRTHQRTAFDVAKTTLQRIPAKFGKLGGGDITIHGPVTCTG